MRMRLPLLLSLFAAFVWMPCGTIAQAQAKGEKGTIFELLHFQQVLEIEMAFNFEDLEKNRRNEERFDAIIRFVDAKNRPQLWNVELNVRGRYRRLHCAFPPMKMNFKKKELAAINLKEHNNLKLVTHCLTANIGDDYVLREYLAYQLYRDLTHLSYRTQLIRITYLDTHSSESFTRYGIILEDEKELADRYSSELCEDCFGVDQKAFDPDVTRLLDLFQYMIGNADWSPKILRNVKLLKPDNGDPFLLVPYDFDFTGFVNALYVKVPPHLGVSDIRERVYLGFPHSTDKLMETFTFMDSRKEVLFDEIEDFPYINKKTRRDLREYIKTFFLRYRNVGELQALAENPKDLIKQN